MEFSKVILFLTTVVILTVGARAGVVAHAPLTYTQVAPQNVLPFAASVSTFSRGLPLFAAPYAAGVLPGHVHAAPVAHAAPIGPVAHAAPIAPVAHAAPLAPAPLYPRVAPGVVATSPFLPAARFAPAGLVPEVPAVVHGGPAVVAPPVAGPPAYLPAPVALGARSIHAVSPAYVPGFHSHLLG